MPDYVPATVAASRPAKREDKPARAPAVPPAQLELTGHDLADVTDALIDAAQAARTLAAEAGARGERELADQASAKAARLERLVSVHARAALDAMRAGK